MFAATTAVTAGTPVILTIPADVGAVRVYSPDGPASLSYNVPNIHGNNQFVAQQDALRGDALSSINGIRQITLRSASGTITAIVCATRK